MKGMSLRYVSPMLYLMAFVLGQFQQSTPSEASDTVKDNANTNTGCVMSFYDTTSVIPASRILSDSSLDLGNTSYSNYYTYSPDLSESAIIDSTPASYLWKDVYFLWNQLTSLAKHVTIPEFIRPKPSTEEQDLDAILWSSRGANKQAESEVKRLELSDFYLVQDAKYVGRDVVDKDWEDCYILDPESSNNKEELGFDPVQHQAVSITS